MARLTGKKALICGDGRTLIVTAAFDVTGYTVTFTMKSPTALSADTDAGAVIQKAGSIIDGPNGLVHIVLTGDDTRIPAGKYVFDIQFDDGENEPISLPAQPIEFREDVTKTKL